MSGIPSAGRFAVVLAVCVLVGFLVLATPILAEPPGGWLEKADSGEARPTWTAAEIQAFLPARGKFMFPAPYDTEGIRITNAADCRGQDCVTPLGGSHWRNINNHSDLDSMLILLGLKGIGPTLFRYHKRTGEVENLGAVFDADSPFARHSGQGWYFSATQPTKLYLPADGSRLLRYDVQARTFEVVFDANRHLGARAYLSRTHSSDDDRVHSATLRDSVNHERRGCLVYREDLREFLYQPGGAGFLGCQVDKSGRWLLLKEEVDAARGPQTRIIDLETRTGTGLLDVEGAAAPADSGYGDMVAPDHAAFACGTSASADAAPRANEIVCFPLDGSLDVLVVTQTMTDLTVRRGRGRRPDLSRGNLDVTGRYFLWVTNMGTDRADAFMVRVPAHLLTDRDHTPSELADAAPAPQPVAAAGLEAASVTASALPVLPQVLLDTTYAPPAGSTITVNAGGDLQSALNAAVPGSVIELQAGATFTGNFVLPNKAGAGWIYVRSSAHASLPAPGNRVSPSHATLMPRIVSPNTMPALATAAGAHHYRFVGVDITATHATTASTLSNLISLEASGGQTSLGQVPTDIVFDRCYIHGTATGDIRRGIAMNSARTAVVDSHLSRFHEVGQDSQAICGWNGPGPFKIVNNYLEGAGENVMFGGADPTITNLVPSDIEIRGNHFFKPLTWKKDEPSYAGIEWSVKNLFELKNAQRVLVHGNILENNWVAAQNGVAVLFTPRSSGTAPWSVVQDVTFTHNIVRHSASAVLTHGTDTLNTITQNTRRIVIADNVFAEIGSARWGRWTYPGSAFIFYTVADDVTIDHNTIFNSGPAVYGDISAGVRFVYRNNIAPYNRGTANYELCCSGVRDDVDGIGGRNTTGNANLTLSTYFPGAVFVRNVLAGGGGPTNWPADNSFPATMDAVGFVDRAAGDYRLGAASPYKNAGTDGKDLGADIGAVNAATATAINGNSDTTAPTVAITAPAGGSTVSGAAVTVSAGAADDVAVAGVQFKVDGVNVGAEDTSHPFAIPWNTLASANGTHSLTAVARDAAGNATTSAVVTVTVTNPVDTVSGLIAHLKMDEGGGTVAADASGNGNAGALLNGAAWTAGARLGAVALDGLDDHVRVPHAAMLDAFPLTAAVWFKTTTAAGVRGLVNKYMAGSYSGYQLFFSDGSLCAWFIRDTANYVYDGGSCTMRSDGYNDGQWHQAVFVVDAAGGRLYLDGVQKASRVWTGLAGPPATTRDIHLGHYPGAFGGAEYLPGAVDEFRLYARALLATEVSQLYQGGPPNGDVIFKDGF